MKRWVLAAILLTLPLAAVQAQEADSTSKEETTAEPSTAKILFHGTELFEVASIGPVSAETRSGLITGAIQRIAGSPLVNTNDLVVSHPEDKQGSVIMSGSNVVCTVWQEDADLAGVPREKLAEHWRDRIHDIVDKYRKDRTTESYLRSAGYAAGATLVLLIFWLLIRWIARREMRFFEKKFADRQMLKFVDGNSLILLNGTLVKLAKAVTMIVVLIFYLNVVLSFFPWTFNLSARLFTLITTPLHKFARAFVDYLPNLVTLVVIILIVWFLLRGLKYVFAQISEGKVRIRGFYRDWADTTYSLVRTVVIIFALVAAYPYIPGGKSDAFKGISIFVGILFSLGSTSAVGNFFGGLMLTYMRSFSAGDFVEINGMKGSVLSRRAFSTRLKTPTNEVISIPNSAVSSNPIINYSEMTKSVGVNIGTSITIGYDVPWREVHELLLESATKVPDVMEVPAPKVHQLSLDDFYVKYKLVVATKNPARMVPILSALHQNIQDSFARGGIEIMSPHYQSNRADAEITIPDIAAAEEE